MKQPEFDAAYREARRMAFRQSIARMQQASGAAVSTLLKIMLDTSAPASTRLRAADIVIGHTAKAIEIEDVEVRVAALGCGPRRTTMKSIARRLQRLEHWVSSQRNDAGATPADVLRVRIRRRAEADGVPFEESPSGKLTYDRGRHLSVAEILRGR
jgi:hypothetical protein